MSRHLERLLQIDNLLHSGSRQTIPGMAAVLEVSDRTVHNDLNFLKDRYDAPLEFDRERGWYYTNSDWRLPSISLSRGELFAVTLGARMLEAYAGSAYEQDLRSAIALLAKRLPEQSWVDLQQLASDRVLFRAGAEVDLDPDIWHDLERACQQKRSVALSYYTAGRNAYSQRTLDPYVLHFSRNNPYVTGYCHSRKEVRWFRVDRIQTLELLEETFEIDASFDAQDHFAMVFQHEAGGIPTAISIWFDASVAPYIRERRWHPTQQIEEHSDESLTLNFVARGLNEVKRWVLFYGKGAIVKSPPELVEAIRQDIEAMHENYHQKS